MKLDRLILDIFDWVRRVLWHREGEVKQSPYAKIQTWRGTLGVLNQVQRDTPRAIATYTFMPFRHGKSKDAMIDTHIFLDTLAPLDGKRPKQSQNRKFTHRLTVVQASHWVKPDASYDAESLYVAEWDFQGRSQYPDRYAQQITQQVAKLLLTRLPEEVDWEFEVMVSVKQLMGTQANAEALSHRLR